MLKNKEDDFLGDHITNNIKYADNEWQAQGTVDRGSAYTKESILHLLFEGFDYKKDLGDYEKYIARASTKLVTSTDLKGASNYVAAKLQHDLYLLDTLYYISTSTSCNKNIFDVSTFLKKGIAVSNPVYDDRSKVDVIELIPRDFASNPATKDIKVIDILKFLSPYYYTGEFTVTSEIGKTEVTMQFNSKSSDTSQLSVDDIVAQLGNIINRYNKDYTFETLKRKEQGEADPFGEDIIKASHRQILNMKLSDFLTALSEQTVAVNGVNTNVKEVFLKDFTLNLHDINTIKMPFNRRGSVQKNNTVLTEDSDFRTYLTRFLANSVSENVYENVDSTAKVDLHYQEFLNDILEEALYANLKNVDPVYPGRTTVDTQLETDSDLATRFFSSGSKYVNTISKDKLADRSSLETFARIVDNANALIALYCPDVYTGYSTTNPPEASWGIYYLNEENTENLFQNKDETYKVYNNVLLGYRLADALISLRTCIGGFLFLERYANSDTVTDTVYTITKDIPISQRDKSAFFSDFIESKESFYPAISMLNNIYQFAHGLAVTSTEREVDSSYSYEFAPEIRKWLENECIIFKGPVYGDYVEELNFLQDLTPDSDVHFNNLRVKKTEIPYRRFQDSKYEVPFVEQTAPLLNNTKDNEIGIGVYGSDAFAGIGNMKGRDEKQSRNTLPPFIYDYDKGEQADEMATVVDKRVLNKSSRKQRIRAKQGTIVAEDGIVSPTIDELWTFLKYLTESDGSGVDSNINERLPKFFGVKKDAIGEAFGSSSPKAGFITNSKNSIVTNRLNPLYTANSNEKVIDILNWEPVKNPEPALSYSSEARVELQFGGYEVTRYIEKIYDYEVHPFSRRSNIYDSSLYEFNTEDSNDFNNVTGYLEKIYNQAILSFDLVNEPNTTTLYVDSKLLEAHPLENSKDVENKEIFSKTNDNKLKSDSNPVHATTERQKAFRDVARLLNYHDVDKAKTKYIEENGVRKDTSYHNHFKKYLENPKNLKEIERDLETIRQNLQTLAEFMVSTYAPLGYADRAKNRGTLHQLHKNAYDWLSTWIADVNETISKFEEDSTYHVTIKLKELTDSLNDINRTLSIVEADKKVTFDDGPYIDRYLHDWYDHFVLDLNTNVEQHLSGKHPMYRVNETLLSETYLAADGTWRSVHEHVTLPVIFDEH